MQKTKSRKERKIETLQIRLTTSQKRRLDGYAAKQKLGTSTWLLGVGLKIAGKT